MSESKSTPGPWHVAGYGVLGPSAKLSDCICTTETSKHVEERRANALLISAAPDLLDAAQLALAWETGDDVGPMTSDGVIARLRSAISKAKGL